MLSSFRSFSKSWIAVALLGLLAISFAVVGQRDIFHPAVKDAVVTAGDRVVTRADFKREFDRVKSANEQRMQRPITTEEAAANGLDRQLADELGTRDAFFALLDKIGLRPSDKLVADQIHSIPAFFDQITGKFDKKLYEERLAQNGLTAPAFEQEIRDETAEQQLAMAMVHGLRVPRAYGAMAAIYGLERRDVGYFALNPNSVPRPAAPTDAQLTAFMKEVGIVQPEQRVLTVAHFDPAQFVDNKAPIDPAELKKHYEFRRDTVSSPETRTILEIPAKDQATAAAIAARWAKGEDPAAIAKSVGVDLITLAEKPQSAVPDRKVAAAAFAMKEGQVSGPVQGDLGFAVVKVAKVTPGHVVSMEEMRPQLEAEIRKDAAAEKVYEMSQAYEDARDSGANLTDAAKKAGVTVVTTPPVTQQGAMLTGQPVPGMTPKMLETAFGLAAGGESDLQDAGQGEYFAVRVEKIIPSGPPPLTAEIRPRVEAAWMTREVLKALQNKAAAYQAELKQGKSLEAVATESGSKVTRVLALDRQTAGQNKALSQDALAKAFNTKPGGVFIAQDLTPGLIVGKVEAVHAPTSAEAAQLAEASRAQMTMTVFQELGESARQAARAEMKAKVDYNAARTAIGLTPAAVTKSTKPAKSGLAGLAK